jgi:hypothetical protein
MSGDQVNIKIVKDPASGQTAALAKGSELLVDSTTATTLILSGAAIELQTE